MADDSRQGWQFWIDRGGTFTDIVGRAPDGQLHLKKLLSEDPERYEDAALAGVRSLLDLESDAAIPPEQVDVIKMGTTVATNALLTRGGDPVLLLTNRGHGDALRIGYQARPDLFARQIVKPAPLFAEVIEVAGRVDAQGHEWEPLQPEAVREQLADAYRRGLRACAIVLMHGYRYPQHEQRLAQLAKDCGFTQVSVSHSVSPLQRLIARGETTVADAYLSPTLRRYVEKLQSTLGGCRLLFMQSNGGLVAASQFAGKDSVLSGPAGGIVGASQTSVVAGNPRVITFDMGGTSTDVALFDGRYERSQETTVAGVRLRVPMLNIHTVAAGGGSLLHYRQDRFQVGPDSAGADPGPACYRKGGPLTVTDSNVLLGRIQPAFFPQVFGSDGRQALDTAIVQQRFAELAREIATTGQSLSAAQVAAGFLRVAVESMANAIKHISVGKGHDVTRYALCCFGGAGGQHACLVADTLGIEEILIHPLAGVLSAYGMGLAERRTIRTHPVFAPLSQQTLAALDKPLAAMSDQAEAAMRDEAVQGCKSRRECTVHLHYAGADTQLPIPLPELGQTQQLQPLQEALQEAFAAAHRRRFGFSMPNRTILVASMSVEVIVSEQALQESSSPQADSDQPPVAAATVPMYCNHAVRQVALYRREELNAGQAMVGPVIIADETSTTVVDHGWRAKVESGGRLRLRRHSRRDQRREDHTARDPILLEVFNQRFMSIADQMGITLAQTAHSVNIKERLDFSCALFDHNGELVANAPHVPVHLGSMGLAVKALIASQRLQKGDAFALNAPYNGGTHLPDITVVTPMFDPEGAQIRFYVASRGHHADVGGISPGSMPARSTSVHEEGVLLDNLRLVEKGVFQEDEFRRRMGAPPHAARNVDQNVADILAQLAANETGIRELQALIEQCGLATVTAYMQHVQDNAEQAVRRVIDRLKDGSAEQQMDDGSVIAVRITIDRQQRNACIDFSGTSRQRPNNFNAPSAVCYAAVLYVFRTLVDEAIPLNAGCLKPLRVLIPTGCMLDPQPPAAVVAGNVETSQAIAEVLYRALGALASSQGTMNNFSFGNGRHQYYETLGGGSGAGPGFDGADAVQTHMTNSRLTDPEVLEARYPVLLEHFGIRQGSGGRGMHRGGCGAVRRMRFMEPMTASILSNSRVFAPRGLAGGAPGQRGRNWIRRATGEVVQLAGVEEFSVEAGDTVVIETPGGGGYGDAGGGE